MNLIPINDLSDPRLAPYANMRDAELAQRADPLDRAAHGGLFVAEGELVLRRLVASRFAVHSVLTTASRVETLRDDLGGLPAEVPVFVAEQRVLNEIVGFNMHRGVLAIGRRGAGLSLGELCARPGPLVVLEDLVNHDNIGGIFRNAGALGGKGVGIVLSPRCADPLYRKSVRVSMGCALDVPYSRAEAWPEALHTIAEAGFETLALTPGQGSVPIREAVGTGGKVALVLGGEGPGLTETAMGACSRRVKIPMNKVSESVDSLNVAMAAGIALFCLSS
ncbi:MAG TPA: RNA methyltransferase [Phycisphaerales bacterium]|nr:RNA methyltransferase [Phycisphaerales bacterium]